MTRSIVAERLRSQRLAGNVLRLPADVVRWFGAVQAQEYGAATWALGQRSAATTSAAIDRALADGSILRTHVMRPTWHFVAPEDIRWLLALTAPRVEAIAATYYRRLGLDAATLRRGSATIVTALERAGHLTRRELADALRRRGIAVDGMRLGFLVAHAELSALICSGPRLGKRSTYALLDERAPASPAFDRDEALRELATRYFTSHGPATPHDFSWWSGLTVADARRAIDAAGRALARVTFDGTAYWTGARRLRAGRVPPLAHLLPVYDEFLIAYRERSAAFEPAIRAKVSASIDVLAAHFVVASGHVVGGWKRDGESEVAIRPRLLRRISRAERAAVEAAAKRYAAFLERPVRIEWSMTASRGLPRGVRLF